MSGTVDADVRTVRVCGLDHVQNECLNVTHNVPAVLNCPASWPFTRYGANSCSLNLTLKFVLSFPICKSERESNIQKLNRGDVDYHCLDTHEVADVVLMAKKNLNRAEMQG